MTAPRRALVLVAAAVLAVAAACGVEVPDDVAAEVASSSTTEPGAPSTTAVPTSDDELEQTLIDNGYSLDEARCGAANLRDQLDDDEVDAIIDADTIEDIPSGTARDFADALRPCLAGGAAPGGDPGGTGPGPDGGAPGDEGPDRSPPDDDGPDDDEGGGSPGIGDGGEGPVTRSRFLAGLVAAGVPEDEAECIVDGVFRRLDRDEIDLLFRAGSEDEIPPRLLAEFQAVADGCE